MACATATAAWRVVALLAGRICGNLFPCFPCFPCPADPRQGAAAVCGCPPAGRAALRAPRVCRHFRQGPAAHAQVPLRLRQRAACAGPRLGAGERADWAAGERLLVERGARGVPPQCLAPLVSRSAAATRARLATRQQGVGRLLHRLARHSFAPACADEACPRPLLTRLTCDGTCASPRRRRGLLAACWRACASACTAPRPPHGRWPPCFSLRVGALRSVLRAGRFVPRGTSKAERPLCLGPASSPGVSCLPAQPAQSLFPPQAPRWSTNWRRPSPAYRASTSPAAMCCCSTATTRRQTPRPPSGRPTTRSAPPAACTSPCAAAATPLT